VSIVLAVLLIAFCVQGLVKFAVWPFLARQAVDRTRAMAAMSRRAATAVIR
jgi:hypothetical protein